MNLRYIYFISFGFLSLSAYELIIKKNIIKKEALPFHLKKIDSTKFLKKQELINYIEASNRILPNLKNGKPFDKMDYNKVIAYDFLGSEEPFPDIIDRYGNFVPVILKQKALTQEQADKILKVLSSNSTYGDGSGGCFNPHFSLIFYKNAKKVNQISICLGCNLLGSEVDIPAQTHKKINKGTKQEYAIVGFTKKGRKAINDLCKELEFTYVK